MTFWIKAAVIVLVALAIVVAIILVVGEKRVKQEKAALTEKLVNKLPAKKIYKVDFASLKDLPEPVEKYFRYALTDGQSFIRTSWLEQTGELKIAPESNDWSTFKATQIISQDAASFLWDAKISMAPFFHVRVADSLIDGAAAGNVYLMSAISIARDKDKAELNSAALYRYLAEAVWHPTALLPQSGVVWESVDENRAVAHFTKFNISISLEFIFNNAGQIVGIYTRDRYGKFADGYFKYPWQGRFSDYKEFDGMKIPARGEVGWHLPNGWWLFWKGQIVDANFEFADG